VSGGIAAAERPSGRAANAYAEVGGVRVGTVEVHGPDASRKVTLSFSLENRSPRAVHSQRVLTFLTSPRDTFRLARSEAPGMSAGQRRELHLTGSVGPRVRPGSYAVSVCLARKAVGHCASSEAAVVTVAGPRLAASTHDLDFGTHPAGSAGPWRQVVYTNTGASWTGRLHLALSGDRSAFQVTSGCRRLPHGLAPGTSCSISARFAPSSVGTRSAQLLMRGSRSGGVVTQLHGVGLQPARLAFELTSTGFGSVQVGRSRVQEVTVVNRGGAPTGALVVTVTGPGFTDDQDLCAGQTLAPGESCDVLPRFTPAAAGAVTGQLSVSAGPGGVITAVLSGRGVGPG
jgi:hypothetical protein